MVLVVSLPAVTSCTKKLPKSTSVIGCAAEVAVQDEGGQVLLGLARPGGAVANSMAYMAISIDGAVVGLLAGQHVGVLAARSALGQLVEVGPVLRGQPHELADDPRRQARGDVVHELDVALRRPPRRSCRGRCSRIWGSSRPMTLALKLSAIGRR